MRFKLITAVWLWVLHVLASHSWRMVPDFAAEADYPWGVPCSSREPPFTKNAVMYWSSPGGHGLQAPPPGGQATLRTRSPLWTVGGATRPAPRASPAATAPGASRGGNGVFVEYKWKMKNYGLSSHCARARACQRRGNPTLNECVAAGDPAAVHRSDGCAAPGSRLSRAEGGAGRGGEAWCDPPRPQSARGRRAAGGRDCASQSTAIHRVPRRPRRCWSPRPRGTVQMPSAWATSVLGYQDTPASRLPIFLSAGLPRHTSFQAADFSGKFFNCGGERKPFSFRSWNCLEGEAKRWRGLEVRKVQRLRGDQFYLLCSLSQPPRPCLLSFLFWTPENLNWFLPLSPPLRLPAFANCFHLVAVSEAAGVGNNFIIPVLLHFTQLCAEWLQSCPTLCDPMDCSFRGSSVHGNLQAKILEWVAIFSSGDLPDQGIEPVALMAPALAGGFFFFFFNHSRHLGNPLHSASHAFF